MYLKFNKNTGYSASMKERKILKTGFDIVVLDFIIAKTWITTSTECSKESEEHRYLQSKNQR